MSAMPDLAARIDDATFAVEALTAAAAAHRNDPRREGATIHLPEDGRLVMTGDLHDHTDNLARILKLAALDESLDHHVVLHEVVHPSEREEGAADLSIRTLVSVAALKARHPLQVLGLLSNHELAQVRGEPILKGGTSVNSVFDAGVDTIYGSGADTVREAMSDYVLSLPLAVKCPYGILCTHSLPSPRQLERFDPTVIERTPTQTDLARDGSAYDLVWGRRHTQAVADELGMAWDVDLFLMGHQPAEMGHYVEGDTMIVLASDHSHGVALPIDLTRPYRLFDLVQAIRPLNAVRL
jgi:hypothetical protein